MDSELVFDPQPFDPTLIAEIKQFHKQSPARVRFFSVAQRRLIGPILVSELERVGPVNLIGITDGRYPHILTETWYSHRWVSRDLLGITLRSANFYPSLRLVETSALRWTGLVRNGLRYSWLGDEAYFLLQVEAERLGGDEAWAQRNAS